MNTSPKPIKNKTTSRMQRTAQNNITKRQFLHKRNETNLYTIKLRVSSVALKRISRLKRKRFAVKA